MRTLLFYFINIILCITNSRHKASEINATCCVWLVILKLIIGFVCSSKWKLSDSIECLGKKLLDILFMYWTENGYSYLANQLSKLTHIENSHKKKAWGNLKLFRKRGIFRYRSPDCGATECMTLPNFYFIVGGGRNSSAPLILND